MTDGPSGEHAREMYRRFLASEYPGALAAAEHVLLEQPNDFMAQSIAAECRAAMGRSCPGERCEREESESASAPTNAPRPVPPEPPTVPSLETTAACAATTLGYLTRQMCQRFLESDHPGALALAEEVLREDPEDRMARAIADQCRAAIEPSDPLDGIEIDVDLDF
jgi:hypothetical protein